MEYDAITSGSRKAQIVPLVHLWESDAGAVLLSAQTGCGTFASLLSSSFFQYQKMLDEQLASLLG